MTLGISTENNDWQVFFTILMCRLLCIYHHFTVWLTVSLFIRLLKFVRFFLYFILLCAAICGEKIKITICCSSSAPWAEQTDDRPIHWRRQLWGTGGPFQQFIFSSIWSHTKYEAISYVRCVQDLAYHS